MRAVASPRVIGHRGACGYRPEHTEAAYRLAFDLGADFVEPDIVSTKDGVLVLRHENDISATTNVTAHPEFSRRRTTKMVDGVAVTGWFTEDFTWAELATLRSVERLGAFRQESQSFDGDYPILRLRDLFAIVDQVADSSVRTLGIVAEIKHATYFASIGLPLDELFAAELSRAGWAEERERLIVESFERTVLRQIYERGVRADRVYLIEARGAPADQVDTHGEKARRYRDEITEANLYAMAKASVRERIEGISVNKSLLLRAPSADEPSGVSDIVDLAHAAGLSAYCWTLRPENRFLSAPFRHGFRKSAFGNWRGEYRAIMDTGVDGVFADHPDLAVILRSERTNT